MDENIRVLLTWDNILLALCVAGFSGGAGYIVRASFRDNPVDSEESEPAIPKEKIKIEDLSQNWIDPKKEKREKIFLTDLYYRWRAVDNKKIPKNDNTVVHAFKNDRVRKFFYKYIHEKTYFKNARKQRVVIVQILKMLDNEGGCPSVVCTVGDPERTELTQTTYGVLSRVSLMNHTLNVAETICQFIKKESPQGAMLMVPDALVCALGHDLGKLPRFCADGYTHGAHPLTSNSILQDVTDFKLLKNREEIENAIKRHHHPNLDKEKSILLRLLGAADSKARVVEQDVVLGLDKERFENQRYVYQEREGSAASQPVPVMETTSADGPTMSPEEPGVQVQSPETDMLDGELVNQEPAPSNDQPQEEVFYDAQIPPAVQVEQPKSSKRPPKKDKSPGTTATGNTKPPVPESPEAIAKAKKNIDAAWKEQEFLYGISNPNPEIQVEQAKTVALEGWFNPEEFLADLEKQVNQVDRMRICAFSMSTGKIYVSPETMVRLVQKQAKKAKVGWLTELDEYVDLSGKKNPAFPKVWSTLLIGIVDLFRSQGFIDPCIRPGFYGNRFLITSDLSPTVGTLFYTVFLANAFKLTIPQLESKKIASRVLIIKDVKLAKSEMP